MNGFGLKLLTRALIVGGASACVCACGGGAAGAGDAASEKPARLGAVTPVSTLLDDDGSVMPSAPASVPADAGARTRAGLYASSEQAAALERALGDDLIRVDVECCGRDGVDQAMGIAYGVQAASNLPNSVPVLVRSADLRLGAVAANSLLDAGYPKVWLVTR